uniref:Ras-GAP domain-containing protein n=1 Tax=Trichuris muris TaxID=70415 RepID=A0A5S6QDW1_TRIMR
MNALCSQKPLEWVSSLIARFEEQLPVKTGPLKTETRLLLEQSQACLINVSKMKFSMVVGGLIRVLQMVNSMKTCSEQDLFDSQCFILDTLEQCLAGPQDESSRLDEENNVKLIVLEMCKFIQIPVDSNQAIQLKGKASKVLYGLSISSFDLIFSRIVFRLKSMSTETSSGSLSGETALGIGDAVDIELMQYIHFNLKSLIKLLREISYHRPFRKDNNQILFNSIENAIWNWMDTYPDRYYDLQIAQNPELDEYCYRLFNQLDSFAAESSKRRASIWPLQMMLLILCPKVLQQVRGAKCGAPCQPRLEKQKLFLQSIEKTLTMGHTHTIKHHLLAAACMAGAKLCKAATYISVADSENVFFSVLQTVVDEVKSYLFSATKPLFKSLPSVQELDVMIECFVALFRLNHDNEVFRICLNAQASIPHRLVLVMGLYRIAVQARLPWWPKIDLVYSRSEELVQIFNDTLSSVCQGAQSAYVLLSSSSTATSAHMPLKMTQSLHKMTGKLKDKSNTVCSGLSYPGSIAGYAINLSSTEDTTSSRQLLFWLIRLMCIEPKLFLRPADSGTSVPVFVLHESSLEQRRNYTSELINGLVSLIVSNSEVPELAQEAMEAVLCMLQPENVELWQLASLSATVQSLWNISSQLLLHVCQKLLHFQLSNFSEILRWLRQLLIYRNVFLMKHREIANYGSGDLLCKQAAEKLETVCFVYLWSLDNDAAITALSLFRVMCEEAEIRSCSDELPAEYVHHAELANATNLQTVGRAVLQKSINSYLKKLTVPTTGCRLAWEDTYRYWTAFTKFLKSFPKSKFDESLQMVETLTNQMMDRKLSCGSEFNLQMVIKLWANMTGFLCATGGVVLQTSACANAAVSAYPVAKLNPTVDSEKSAHPVDFSLPNQDMLCSVANFLNQLLSLLLIPSQKLEASIVRHVKELCSYELHLSLIGHFFEQIHSVTSRFSGDSEQVNVSPQNTDFVEHVVYVMKNILLNCSKLDARTTQLVCIEPIMLNLCKYAHLLEVGSHAFVIKGKICQLVKVVMTHRDHVVFQSEIRFRNKLVDLIAAWIICSPPSCSGTTAMNCSSLFPSEAVSALRELNLCCMDALATLIKDLPLQSEESTSNMDMLGMNKSQLFQKFFNLFMNLLNDCTLYENVTNSQRSSFKVETIPLPKMAGDSVAVDRNYTSSSTPGVSASSSATARRFDENKDKMDRLRSATIQAMSALLAANIDIGLEHAIGMGYHKDSRARVAFVEVLTKVLQEGTEFETLNETVMADRFEELVKLTTIITSDGELPIVNALAYVVQTEHMDGLARLLTTLFASKNLLHELLWKLFTKEVELAEAPTTLFRGNTLASKVMGCCFKLYGYEYLHSLLRDFIYATTQKADKCYEVDQSRLDPGGNLAENTTNLMNLVENILNLILNSADQFPIQLKSMLNVLFHVVNARFPNTGLLAVGMIVFLRFFNPAIVSPVEYGLTDVYPSASTKRGLMLVSKILQQIANQAQNVKENCLHPFSVFIHDKYEIVKKFSTSIAVDFKTHEKELSTGSFAYGVDTPACALHLLLWRYQDRIGEFFNTFRSHDKVSRRLAALLAQLGPAEGDLEGKQWVTIGFTCGRFEEIMEKQSAADKEEYKFVKESNIFYQYGSSRTGNPVFYFIASRFKAGEVNGNMLIYHALLTLKQLGNQPCELVVDLTHTCTENRFRTDLLTKWFAIISHSVQQRIAAVYLCNCNSWVQEYTRFHDRLFSNLKGNRKLHFLDNVRRLNEYISPENQLLPATTLQLDEDVKTFNNVVRVSHRSAKCSVKIGPTALQVVSLERQKVLGHLVILNDVYHAFEIEEVCAVDENSVMVTILNESSPLSLIHSECEQIATALAKIRSTYELSQPDQSLMHTKIRAKDVPGTLLNMALLNLGSTDPSLRTAAYNLLCALAATFNFRMEGQLLETKGLLIPANNTIFIKTVSQKLAVNETHLTLEFLQECIQGFRQSSIELKHLCLEYITPWLANLPRFCRPTLGDESKRQAVSKLLGKLITLTIEEFEMYPSIQAKIWGNVGQVSELLDLILDRFIRQSIAGGLGSVQAEVLADTAVTLAAANTQLVSDILIRRLMHLLEKSCLNPQISLEEHILWDDIALLARYLLFLSFNNCLDVITHLPVLFHFVTVLVNTGPLALRASVHGLVVNVIHSLCTCPSSFTEGTKTNLRLALTEFFLPKFYRLFGVSNLTVKTVAATAFRISPRMSLPVHANSEYYASGIPVPRQDRLTLANLEVITDSLIELIETCNQDLDNRDMIQEWAKLAHHFSLRFNPALQGRALIVYSCLSKTTEEVTVKQLLNLLLQFVKRRDDSNLLSAVLMALRRLTPSLPPEHCNMFPSLFWISIIILQFEDPMLYEHGLALLEQIVLTLTSSNVFEYGSFEKIMMGARPPLEWEFKAMDQQIGLSFKHHFHFALVSYLLKGYRHPSQSVPPRTRRLLDLLLSTVARCTKRERYEVTTDTVAYLVALLPVSEEVRLRCPLHSRTIKALSLYEPSECSASLLNFYKAHMEPICDAFSNQQPSSLSAGHSSDQGTIGAWKQRHQQRSCDNLDAASPSVPSAVNSKQSTGYASQRSYSLPLGSTVLCPLKESSAANRPHNIDKSLSWIHSAPSTTNTAGRSPRPSELRSSYRETLLLDPEVICEPSIQVLTLTILSTLVRYSTDDKETRILFEYLAEASVVFPAVFPVIHSLLDQRITQVLQVSHDAALLRAVLHIIQNMIPNDGSTVAYKKHHFTLLQNYGFGGLWRFAGPFPMKPTSQLAISPETLTCLERIIGNLGEIPPLTPPPLTPCSANVSSTLRFDALERLNSSPAD